MQGNDELNQKKFRLYGMITFAAVMCIVLFGFLIIPFRGLYASAVVEGVLLLLAAIAFLASKRPFQEVFPIKVPTVRSLRGALFVWLGASCVSVGISAMQMSLFPGMIATSVAINKVIGSAPIWLRLLVVVLMAGVCEEAVHRGVLLSSIDNIKSVVLRVFIMAICFGLFHTDPYRFLPTAILGAGLTYVVIKSGNLLLSMMLHALNNLLPSLLAGIYAGMDMTADISLVASVYTPKVCFGVMLVYGAMGIPLLYAGSRQLVTKESLQKPNLKLLLPIICLMLLCGFAVMLEEAAEIGKAVLGAG